jgi:hypothetical protein
MQVRAAYAGPADADEDVVMALEVRLGTSSIDGGRVYSCSRTAFIANASCLVAAGTPTVARAHARWRSAQVAVASVLSGIEVERHVCADRMGLVGEHVTFEGSAGMAHGLGGGRKSEASYAPLAGRWADTAR